MDLYNTTMQGAGMGKLLGLRRVRAVVAGVALTAIAGAMIGTGSAHAGQWMRTSCVNPDGSAAANEGWTGYGLGGLSVGSSNKATCGPGDSMIAFLGAGSPAAAGAAEVLKYTPPENSTLIGGKALVGLSADGYGYRAVATAAMFTPEYAYDASNVFLQCVAVLAACQNGLANFYGVVDLPPGRGGSLYLAAGCLGQVAGTYCTHGANRGAWSVVGVQWANLLLSTGAAPTAKDFTGSLLEPVAGEAYDLVVSNPPFVIGPGARYTYRDAGLDGDELCRRLVGGLPSVLAPGGTAVLLANWLHVEGEDGDARVQSWFGPEVDGWVVQRELAAPEDYVTAWLRDTDEGARFDELYDAWLAWFAVRQVEAVAFGVLAMTPGTGRVHLDDVPQQVAATWGEQVPAFFARQTALEKGVLATAWRLRDDVRLHSVARRTEEGWLADAQLLQQEEGLRWSGGVDVYGATLLAGCDGTRRMGDLIAVLAGSAGISEDEAAEQVLPVVERLVEQGFLVA